jgi:hypothetical protein
MWDLSDQLRPESEHLQRRVVAVESPIAKSALVGSIWGMCIAPEECACGAGRALLEAVIAHAAPSV